MYVRIVHKCDVLQAYELSDANFAEVKDKFILVNREIEKLRANAEKKKNVRNIIRESIRAAEAEVEKKVRDETDVISAKPDSFWIRCTKKLGIQNFRSRSPDGKKNPDYYGPLDRLCWFWRVPCYFLLPMVFLPGGRIQKLWHLFGFYQAILYAIIAPLQLAFLTGNEPILWFGRALDGLGLVAVYLGLHMAFYNKHGILVVHPLYTSKRYILYRFFLDIIASFPFEVFYISTSLTHNLEELENAALIRLSRMLVFYKIPISYARQEDNHFVGSIEWMRLRKYTIFIAVFLNAICCLMFVFTCPPGIFHSTEANVTIGGYKCVDGAWIANIASSQNFSTTAFQAYVGSFYFTAATALCVGYEIRRYIVLTLAYIV